MTDKELQRIYSVLDSLFRAEVDSLSLWNTAKRMGLPEWRPPADRVLGE